MDNKPLYPLNVLCELFINENVRNRKSFDEIDMQINKLEAQMELLIKLLKEK